MMSERVGHPPYGELGKANTEILDCKSAVQNDGGWGAAVGGPEGEDG